MFLNCPKAIRLTQSIGESIKGIGIRLLIIRKISLLKMKLVCQILMMSMSIDRDI